MERPRPAAAPPETCPPPSASAQTTGNQGLPSPSWLLPEGQESRAVEQTEENAADTTVGPGRGPHLSARQGRCSWHSGCRLGATWGLPHLQPGPLPPGLWASGPGCLLSKQSHPAQRPKCTEVTAGPRPSVRVCRGGGTPSGGGRAQPGLQMPAHIMCWAPGKTGAPGVPRARPPEEQCRRSSRWPPRGHPHHCSGGAPIPGGEVEPGEGAAGPRSTADKCQCGRGTRSAEPRPARAMAGAHGRGGGLLGNKPQQSGDSPAALGEKGRAKAQPCCLTSSPVDRPLVGNDPKAAGSAKICPCGLRPPRALTRPVLLKVPIPKGCPVPPTPLGRARGGTCLRRVVCSWPGALQGGFGNSQFP